MTTPQKSETSVSQTEAKPKTGLSKLKYTGVGFGTWILLGIILTFVYWVLFYGVNKIMGQVGVDILNTVMGFVSIALLVMVINTIFLKNQGRHDKVFRIPFPKQKMAAEHRESAAPSNN